jgi:hypothetical protein
MSGDTKKSKSAGFNLIKKEVVFERKLKNETSWFSSLNFVALLTISAFAGLAYSLTVYNNSNLNNEKVEIANYANTNVFVADKGEIESKINILNDKFSLYQEVKGETIDAGEFYQGVINLYPGLKIERFNFRPGQPVDVQLTINQNGYSQLPKFLFALQEKFGDVNVKQISFQNAKSIAIANDVQDADVSVNISLTFTRENLEYEAR